MSAPAPIIIAVEPLTMTRADALRFTGFSSSLFDSLERRRAITPKRFGSRGEKVYYRPQLEQVTASLFAGGSNDDEADEVA